MKDQNTTYFDKNERSASKLFHFQVLNIRFTIRKNYLFLKKGETSEFMSSGSFMVNKNVNSKGLFHGCSFVYQKLFSWREFDF